MTALMEQVFALPTLPEFVEELHARLAEERELREAFYSRVPDGAKWEFIQGEVVMHSPDMVRHMVIRGHLESLVMTHVLRNKLGLVLSEKGLCVFPRNDFMPDVIFFGPEKTARIQPSDLRLPIPDFVCEVLSDSTAHRDRGVKFLDYEAHGVREYWIVDPVEETLEQYLLRDGVYVLSLKSGTGTVRSAVIEALEFPIRAIFDSAEYVRASR